MNTKQFLTCKHCDNKSMAFCVPEDCFICSDCGASEHDTPWDKEDYESDSADRDREHKAVSND